MRCLHIRVIDVSDVLTNICSCDQVKLNGKIGGNQILYCLCCGDKWYKGDDDDDFVVTTCCSYMIVCDFSQGTGTVQKGMPHKCYHGKTGRVYNVTQHAVGIIVNKQVK